MNCASDVKGVFLCNLLSEYVTSAPMLRIHDILVRVQIRIRGSIPMTNGSGFVSDLQEGNKIFSAKFVYLLLLEATFT
jgi:hypothetical protein